MHGNAPNKQRTVSERREAHGFPPKMDGQSLRKRWSTRSSQISATRGLRPAAHPRADLKSHTFVREIVPIPRSWAGAGGAQQRVTHCFARGSRSPGFGHASASLFPVSYQNERSPITRMGEARRGLRVDIHGLNASSAIRKNGWRLSIAGAYLGTGVRATVSYW